MIIQFELLQKMAIQCFKGLKERMTETKRPQTIAVRFRQCQAYPPHVSVLFSVSERPALAGTGPIKTFRLTSVIQTTSHHEETGRNGKQSVKRLLVRLRTSTSFMRDDD